MMQYDGDLLVPSRFLVSPPAIDRTLGEYLARNGLAQLAVSETQKFGHVTYFWNGNRSGYFDESLERYDEIPSDLVPFEQRPWMKAAEITDVTLKALSEGKYSYARLNYANGDMVGHTGDLRATILSLEALDLSLGRLLKGIEKLGGCALITADHGNAEQMFERNKKTGEITVMRVKRGTPMREVMASYASNKGVKAERLSWKRRSSAASNSSPTSRDGSVVVGEKRLDEDGGDECGLPACGCTGFS